MTRKKVLLTGLGSIGSRYKRLLLEMGGVELFALRSGLKPPCEGVKELRSWAEVRKAAPDVAFITNPTFMHIETAIKCASLGMHLFIEKPLDMRLAGLKRLRSILSAGRLSSYVAYNLRLHPGILRLREIVSKEGFRHASVRCSSWLPDWRPGTDHKLSYSSSSGMGGGAVLDLSHDADYAGYIFGKISDIEGRAGRCSDVTRDAEDVADMLLLLEKGKHVSLHVDFCSRIPERAIKVTTPRASYELDLLRGRLAVSRGGRISTTECGVDRDFTYKAEVRYFFKRLGGRMMNDVDEAAGLLRKLIAFKRRNGLI